MIRYKSILCAAAVGGDRVVDALQSTATVRRKVLAVCFDKTADLHAICFLDQDLLLQIDGSEMTLGGDWVEMSLDLEPGRMFKVGYRDVAAAGAAKYFNVKYEET